MIIANNSIRLWEIQSAIINDNNVFTNINSVSIFTIDKSFEKTSNDYETTLQGDIWEE